MATLQIDLSATERAVVRDILARFIPGREVRAFGSRVNGKAKKFSDLELAIMGQEPVPQATMADLRDAFTESDLPYKVDLVDWANTSEVFRATIGLANVSVQSLNGSSS